ncbi:MAG: P1 family peptidase [Pseudomonadota bacterium]
MHLTGPGARNLITDVPGLRVGQAQGEGLKSGVTCLVGEAPFVAGVDIRGAAPGTRDIALLDPERTVQEVDALVLSGGSAFGLDAAGGVMDALRDQGRGFAVGPVRVPIVPAAILFDLLNGGDKNWGARSPYHRLGRAALEQAGERFDLGSAGAGTGAMTARLKGGIGSASWVLDGIGTVGALVAVNPVGCVAPPGARAFYAGGLEWEGEFGGLGLPQAPWPVLGAADTKLAAHIGQGANTTIGIVATDLALDKAGATRLAVAGQAGLARAIHPAHTAFDGDLVFGVATGRGPVPKDGARLSVEHAAATTMARAVARAVYSATPQDGDIAPCWSDVGR